MPDRALVQAVTQLRRRIALAAYLGELARHAAAALLLAGVAALLLRFFFGWTTGHSLAALLLIVPAAATAFWYARRRFVSNTTAATWLDLHLGSTGRVVTAFELATDPSMASIAAADLAQVQALRPRLNWGRLVRPLAPAALFAAAAFLVPVRPSNALAAVPFTMSQLDRVAEKLAALEETVKLDDELRADLEERLSRAKEQGDDAPLSSTFEAIDQLTERIEQEAERAQASLENASESLASDAFSAALQQDVKQAQEIVQSTLQEAARNVRTDNLGLPAELQWLLPPTLAHEGLEGREFPPGVQLDPEQLAKLGKGLGKAFDGKLGELLKSGLIDPAKLRPFTGKLKRHKCDESCRKGGG